MHHHGRWTGLFDLTGASIPFQPAVTLFRLNRFAFTLLGHWLFRPLPDCQPYQASIDALGSKSHRGMAQILFTRVDLYGAHPGLRPGRAVM
jgi:hypothetical protein